MHFTVILYLCLASAPICGPDAYMARFATRTPPLTEANAQTLCSDIEAVAKPGAGYRYVFECKVAE